MLHRSCGFRQALVRQPLLGVCGASGSGKTTIAPLVAAGVSQAAVLEGDLLWVAGMATPEDDYLLFSTRWLMFALELAQGGMPLVLLGAATPGRWERNTVRRYIGPIHYLALVCDDRELQARLRARRAWRQTSGDVFIGRMLAHNRWLRDNAQSMGFELLDTGSQSAEQTAGSVIAWVHSHLPS